MKKRLCRVSIILAMVSVLFCISACGKESSDRFSTEPEESTEEPVIESEEETEKEVESEKEIETEKEEETADTAKIEYDPENKPTETTETKINETQTSKSVETPKSAETPKPAHEHSYSATVTQNATCASNGVKTYTCSCGSSYTEAIPTTEHNWTLRYETVHHESKGEMRQVQVGTKETYWSCAKCGFSGSNADLEAHRKSFLGTDNAHAVAHCYTHAGEPIYEMQWVVTQEAYDEQVVAGYTCTACGAMK